MAFYIVVGVITSLFSYLAFKFYDSHRVIAWTFILFFILFPSIIEGCRDWNLGSDMLGYGQAYFYNAQRYNNIIDFIKDLDSKEYAYHLLNYAASRIGAINVMMFMAALIKMTLVALTCIHFRRLTIPWLMVFCYMMFFYWYGFSLMRQSIALCVSLYSLTFLYDKKYVKFVICALCSYLFHSSGLFTLLIPLVMFMSQNRKKLVITIIGTIIIYGMASSLFLYIAGSGLFGDQMLDRYSDSGVASAKSNILIMIVFMLFAIFYKNKNQTLSLKVLSCSILGLMTLMLSSLFEVAFRLSFYFMMPLLVFVPTLIKNNMDAIKRIAGKIAMIVLFLAHYFINVSHGLADTLPYHSFILDSLFI